MLVAAARRKRSSSVVENPRPHHRARVHSPSPSESEVDIVVNPRPNHAPRVNNGLSDVQPNNATLALPPQVAELPTSSQVPAADALPRKPAHTRVRRPTIIDQLPEKDITDWQHDIRATPKVLAATDPKIKGNKAAGLSGFIILALHAISCKTPVPTHDAFLRVQEAKVPSVYSLLVRYPSFFA